MMRLLGFIAMFIILAAPAAAQDPIVEVTFDENSAIPGQALTLRVTVLVPTWMPNPPVFPSFEASNLLVQLPEGASGPTSRTIDGETWSGVSRRYQITPMVPGSFEVSGQSLTIKWAEPGQTDPLEKTVTLDPIVVKGVVPEGAEELDPFLAAEALAITRDTPDVSMPLSAGDSLSLTVTAKIDGTSSMFLPSLVPNVMIEGLAVYPSEPVLQDSDNRGKVSGSREESVTLVAESGGSGTFPEISVSWYNLSSGKVETAIVEGFDIEIDAPKASSASTSQRVIALYGALGLIAFGLGMLLWRLLAPRVRTLQAERRARFEASETWAFTMAKRAAQAQDLGRLLIAMDVWADRANVDPQRNPDLSSALSALGSVRYGSSTASETAAWRAVVSALEAMGATVRTRAAAQIDLPPLNPIPRSARSF